MSTKNSSRKNILLINPAYPHGKPQVYLPTGLLNFGSRLLAIGNEVTLWDMNLVQEEKLNTVSSFDTICISIVGAPYIPSARRYVSTIIESGFNGIIAIGGQGVARMKNADFRTFFPQQQASQYSENRIENRSGGGIGSNIKQVLALNQEPPSEFDTSMAPMLEKIPEEQLLKYLSQEFSIFTSQGCKYNCQFCQASKAMRETFRSCASLTEELIYIFRLLSKHGQKTVTMYLSSLDTFQNPEKMEEQLQAISSICTRFKIKPIIRGLSTSRSAIQAHSTDPEIIKRWKTYGLQTIAFGSDGASEDDWERQNKKHNSIGEIEDAISICREAHIVVELLMVIGFQDSKISDLYAALLFSLNHALFNRCVIRPYLAKTKTPGGNWSHNSNQEQKFLSDPDTIIRIDYAMLGSKHTHPSIINRWTSNIVYLAIIGMLAPLNLCATRPLVPIPKKGLRKIIASKINQLMPFDK